MARRGGHEGGDGALHVAGAAADTGRRHATRAANGSSAPGGVAGRHHVGVAGEAEMRRGVAEAGEEVVDRRRSVRAGDGEAQSLQRSSASTRLRAGVGGRDRGQRISAWARATRVAQVASIAQQLVDRGLDAGLRVDPLDDHGAGQRRARACRPATAGRAACRAPPPNRRAHGRQRPRRWRGRRSWSRRRGRRPSTARAALDDDALGDFRAGADEAVVLDDHRVGLQAAPARRRCRRRPRCGSWRRSARSCPPSPRCRSSCRAPTWAPTLTKQGISTTPGRDIGGAAHHGARHGAETGSLEVAPGPSRQTSAAPCRRQARRRRPASARSSVSRKDSSTAFFSHSCTTQPCGPGSATRAAPRSSKSSAWSTAARSALLPTESWSRRCQMSSIAVCSAASSMSVPLGRPDRGTCPPAGRGGPCAGGVALSTRTSLPGTLRRGAGRHRCRSPGR